MSIMAARKHSQAAAQGFDSETGQVFIETTCRAGPMTPDWTWKTQGNLESVTKYINAGSGSASLRDISIRKFLANSFNLTPDMIETLPLHLACRLWLEIKRSQLDSLRTWKVFASVFANQLNNRIENKRVVLSDSTTSLVECTKHIDSPSFHYITFLTLSNIDCTRSDLIQLSRLTNLGMLTVRNDGSSCVAFEDNIIRAWGRGASEAGAFTRLRILVCRFQFYITGKIFAYFQTFPALDLVLLDQCRVSREFTNHAKQHEWHAMRRSKSHGGSFAEESPAWKEIYKGLTKEGALFDIDSMQKPSENDEGSQPVLEVSLYSTESHRHGLSKILEPDDMWHFRRKGRPRDSESSATLCPQKRVLVEGSAASSCTSKRPALRTSRQRPVKNLLSDYQV